MHAKIVYLLIFLCANLISLAISSEKYKYISECFHYRGASYKSGADNITFICTDKQNPDLFKQYKHIPQTIHCSNEDEVFSLWPGQFNFENCSFSEFQPDFFRYFTAMYKIDISDMGLEKMMSNTFQYSSDLETLIASNNQLREIPVRMFANLGGLLQLDFANNQIEHIDRRTFAGLGSLEFLNLSRNELTEIDGNLFRDTVNLTTLDLSHNHLTTLMEHTFDHLNQLEYLHLSFNHLKELDALKITMFPELIILDIEFNQFNCSYLQQFCKSINSSKVQMLGYDEYRRGNNREILCIDDVGTSAKPPKDPFNIDADKIIWFDLMVLN